VHDVNLGLVRDENLGPADGESLGLEQTFSSRHRKRMKGIRHPGTEQFEMAPYRIGLVAKPDDTTFSISALKEMIP
jgi:hypothetical protein